LVERRVNVMILIRFLFLFLSSVRRSQTTLISETATLNTEGSTVEPSWLNCKIEEIVGPFSALPAGDTLAGAPLLGTRIDK
jgi:hypothetical protein